MKFYKYLPLILIFFLSACSNKGYFHPKSEKSLMIINEKLSKKLNIKTNYSQSNEDEKFDYIKLTKGNHYLKISMNNNLFSQENANVLEDTKYLLEFISSVINEHKGLEIRVYGYNLSKNAKMQKQNLSDYVAINVAEILYDIKNKNEIFAKGCSIKTKHNSIVDIYIYTDSKYIKEQCR
jgi:hypothetical protein